MARTQEEINTRFDIMGLRKSAMTLSIALLVLSVAALAIRGLNLGIDFTGGYVVEAGFEQAAELEPIREALSGGGFSEAIVQHFGTQREVLVRIAPNDQLSGADVSTKVEEVLSDAGQGKVEMRRVEFVGPQVGEELREQGGLAVLIALAFIVVYIWLRFEKKFSVGAVAALVHDVIITLGVFAITQIEFDLSVLAAILAVIGYSLNDTIVVFDRIRENFRAIRKRTTEQVMNISINQTLSRTIITSLTTLLVLLALFFLGGETIRSFSVALIVGVVVGTYSSIYVASSSVIALGITREDMLPVVKEGDEQLDEIP
ncbi:protein-export membrane protein SecF [Chromatiales bacterium (ex Bugula neritina AB1)]|nr:protein-export membrane protein SecF [Chromatiales bacterium (ex Bugula neritina AB1)]